MRKILLSAVLLTASFESAIAVAGPALNVAGTIACVAGNGTSVQIAISPLQNQPRSAGAADVVMEDANGILRQFAAQNALVVEARDWLHFELRSSERVYANISIRDSVVYGREVAGRLDYQNGNRTLLRCVLKR